MSLYATESPLRRENLGEKVYEIFQRDKMHKGEDSGGKAFHRGTDLACSEGTLVLAAMNGVVIAARRSATYGNYLCLSHSGGQETLYAHLQYLFVRAGEVVQAGQPLGTAGETGRSTGAHLHFELLEQGVRYDAGALLGLP